MRRLPVLLAALPLAAVVVAPGPSTAAGPTTSTVATFASNPQWLLPRPEGGTLVADWDTRAVSLLADDGGSTLFAGTGTAGLATDPNGDGGPATSANLDAPTGMAFREDGSLLVADAQHHKIRLIDNGTVTTIAGTGVAGFSGDDGPSTAAQLRYPVDIEVLPDGMSFLIADAGNHRLRRVDGDSGEIITTAGTGADAEADGPRMSASFKFPQALSLEERGTTVLVADRTGGTVRRVDLRPAGEVETVAGLPQSGATPMPPFGAPPAGSYTGEGAPTEVGFRPMGVTALDGGAFLVMDYGNDRVRLVDDRGRTTETITGTGTAGDGADGQAPTATDIAGPAQAFVEDDGDLVLMEHGNKKIRRIEGLNLDPVAPAWELRAPQGAPTSGGKTGKSHGPGSPGNGDEGAEETPVAETPLTGEGFPDAVAAPVLGKSVGIAPAKGKVRVRHNGGKSFAPLAAGRSVAVGTTVDAREGAVTLTTAGPQGTTQSATFEGGTFTIRQSKSAGGVTDLELRGGSFASCRKTAKTTARAAGAPKPVRRLWGSGKGKFRTHGRDAVASVRGTIWLTEDRCEGTLVKVKRGAVAVDPVRRGRTTIVRAGQQRLVRHASATRP